LKVLIHFVLNNSEEIRKKNKSLEGPPAGLLHGSRGPWESSLERSPQLSAEATI
jgi:hypothetical protein